MKSESNKFWKTALSKKGFEGTWIHINLDEIILPDGSKILFEAIEFQRHGVGVVAVNENGQVVLVKNYRYINDYESWEVPAGTIPPGMDSTDCILEELREEAGCTADKSDLNFIGTYYPSIGSSNQKFHCYFADNVKKVSDKIDTNEILEVKWFTRDELKEMIRSGEIKDGFTLYLLLRYLFMPE
jgi:ADP-ribose pyrophosphatase